MAAVVKFIAKTFVPIGALLAGEHYILRSHPVAAKLYESSPLASFLPKGYALVILINLVVTGFVLIYLGTKVAGARTAFADKAKKDGDEHAEDRFSYPKMQAEGFSEYAKLFNCVQRGHQQALETYTQFAIMSVVGGVSFPVSTAVGGLLWVIARLKWAEGYSTGTPSNRYQSIIAFGIWSSLLVVTFSAIGTASQIAF